MIEEIEFIIDKCPVGLIIFNHKMDIVHHNRKASIFLNRFELPEEIPTISKMLLKGETSTKYFQERFVLQKSLMVHRVTGYSDCIYKKN